MDEQICDLSLICDYARYLQVQLSKGEQPNQAVLNRMRDLAEKVQRHFDPTLAEMSNEA